MTPRWLQLTPRRLECPICGANAARDLVSSPRLDRPAEEARFLRCDGCSSLIHDGPIQAFEHIQQGDRTLFLRQYLENTAGPWEMLWPIGCLADAKTRSLLDVGCGFGLTADLWRHQFNPDAHGCDPAAYALAGRQTLGQHIHPFLLDDAPALAGRTFDLVYASEVIEHVDSPGTFVARLANALSPRGVLVLTTPAAEFIAPEHEPATVVAALAPGFHAFLFSRSALESLLRAQGFSEVVVEQHHERLIAWAGHAPFIRATPASALPPYLDYLARRADGIDVTTLAGASLAAGLAYRDFKERLLRGVGEGLAEAAERANRLALWFGEPATDTSDTEGLLRTIEAVLLGTDEGPKAFGVRFRFCLPQMAFLNGTAAAQRGARPAALAWHALAQDATKKLCASSALNGLEATSFYWVSEQHRLSALIEAGDAQAFASGLSDYLRAIDEPLASIGGSSPTPEMAFAFLETVMDALVEPAYGDFLAIVAGELRAGNRVGVPTVIEEATAALISAVAERLRTGLASETRLATLGQCLDTLRAPRYSRLRTLFQRRLEAERARLRPSFATLSRAGGYAGGYRWQSQAQP